MGRVAPSTLLHKDIPVLAKHKGFSNSQLIKAMALIHLLLSSWTCQQSCSFGKWVRNSSQATGNRESAVQHQPVPFNFQHLELCLQLLVQNNIFWAVTVQNSEFGHHKVKSQDISLPLKPYNKIVGLCLELSTVGQEVRPTELIGGGGGVLSLFLLHVSSTILADIYYIFREICATS